MIHVIGFSGSHSGAAGLLTKLPAVEDGVMNVQNQAFILPKSLRVLFAEPGGATMQDARISAPTFREVQDRWITPIDTFAATSPIQFGVLQPSHWFVPGNQEVSALTSTTAGATERHMIGMVLSDGFSKYTSANVYTVKFTATVTAVVDTWVRGVLTPVDPLPQGTYDCIGMYTVGVSGNFMSRLVFQNQTWRPGIRGVGVSAVFVNDIFRRGNLGKFGSFTNSSVPYIEILSLLAGTGTVSVYLDLVKIA